MTDTLDGRAIGRTVWLPPSGTVTVTLDVSASSDPDISGRDVNLWFQPLSLGAPDVSESLVPVTRDYTDAATGLATYTFDAGALWTAVGSATVRGLVVPASGGPWFSLLVVLDLDGTRAQSATTLPAIVGNGLTLEATLHVAQGGGGGGGSGDMTAAVYDPQGIAGDAFDLATHTGSPADIGAATAAQGVLADTAVQPGDLGDSAGLDVGTTAGTVAAGDDARLSDDRDPNAHASTHQDGGADELALDASQITTGQFNVARVASGTATDGYVPTVSSGSLALAAPAGGDTQPVGVQLRILSYLTPNASSGGYWANLGNQMTGGSWLSDLAINNYVEWNIYLAAGTWTMRYTFTTANNGGIVTPSVAGSDLATVDQYTAGVVYNSVATYTGIVIGTSGVKAIRFRVNSKNASSTFYYSRTSLVEFVRTA